MALYFSLIPFHPSAKIPYEVSSLALAPGKGVFLVVIVNPGITLSFPCSIVTLTFQKIFVIEKGKHNPLAGFTNLKTLLWIIFPTLSINPLTIANNNTALSTVTFDVCFVGMILEQMNFINGTNLGTKSLELKCRYCSFLSLSMALPLDFGKARFLGILYLVLQS